MCIYIYINDRSALPRYPRGARRGWLAKGWLRGTCEAPLDCYFVFSARLDNRSRQSLSEVDCRCIRCASRQKSFVTSLWDSENVDAKTCSMFYVQKCCVRSTLRVHKRLIRWSRALTKCKHLLFTLLDLCESSLRRGHVNFLCIVPILTDDPRRESANSHTHTHTCVVRCAEGVVSAVPCRARPSMRKHSNNLAGLEVG